MPDHKYYMEKVLSMAAELLEDGLEVPIACLIVKDGKIIGQATNQREAKQSILAHAEIEALEQAAKNLGTWNLGGATLYVNLEPCSMCAGAILQSHIMDVVYALAEPKTGALGSRYDLRVKKMNVMAGILEDKAKSILDQFFMKLRQ